MPLFRHLAKKNRCVSLFKPTVRQTGTFVGDILYMFAYRSNHQPCSGLRDRNQYPARYHSDVTEPQRSSGVDSLLSTNAEISAALTEVKLRLNPNKDSATVPVQ